MFYKEKRLRGMGRRIISAVGGVDWYVAMRSGR